MLQPESAPPAWYAAERRQWHTYRLLIALCVLLAMTFGVGLASLVNRLAATTYGTPPTTVIIALDGPLTGLLPGDQRTGRVELTNTGTDRVAYTIRVLSGARDPDLTDALEVTVAEATDPACTGLAGRVLYDGPLQALRLPDASALVAPGTTLQLCFGLRLPGDLGNAFQGVADDLDIVVSGSAAPH